MTIERATLINDLVKLEIANVILTHSGWTANQSRLESNRWTQRVCEANLTATEYIEFQRIRHELGQMAAGAMNFAARGGATA